MKKVLIFWYNFMYKFTEAILCFGMGLNQMKSVLHKYPNEISFTSFFASKPLPRIQDLDSTTWIPRSTRALRNLQTIGHTLVRFWETLKVKLFYPRRMRELWNLYIRLYTTSDILSGFSSINNLSNKLVGHDGQYVAGQYVAGQYVARIVHVEESFRNAPTRAVSFSWSGSLVLHVD